MSKKFTLASYTGLPGRNISVLGKRGYFTGNHTQVHFKPDGSAQRAVDKLAKLGIVCEVVEHGLRGHAYDLVHISYYQTGPWKFDNNHLVRTQS